MAQKRMIDKKISVSEQVDNLSMEAKLIYTWSIPHSDDLGLLPHSHKTLKAMVIPMWNMLMETFGNHMEDIEKQKLIRVFEHEGQKYYKIVNFLKFQTLKRDRQPQTFINFKHFKNPKDSWDAIIKECGFQVEDNGNHLDTEEKRSKENIREEKRREYLLKLPKNDINDFLLRFQLTEKQLVDKAESLHDYCLAKGKTYKDYRAFLRNAVKKDFSEREKQAYFKGKRLNKDGDEYYYYVHKKNSAKKVVVNHKDIDWK